MVKRRITERHNKSLCIRICVFLNKVFTFNFSCPVYITPHFKKHSGKAVDTFTCNSDTGIFPISETFHFIYILISNIISSGMCYFSVDHKYFSVIPVIHYHRKHRFIWIKSAYLDSLFLQLFYKTCRCNIYTSEIIIYYAYLYAFFDLSF